MTFNQSLGGGDKILELPCSVITFLNNLKNGFLLDVVQVARERKSFASIYEYSQG